MSRYSQDGQWRAFVVCSCGAWDELPDGNIGTYTQKHFYEVCAHCGKRQNQANREIRRWISDSIWWKPQTWGTGHWEVREDA